MRLGDLILLQLSLAESVPTLQGQGLGRNRVKRGRVGQQLLEATVSGFDPSSFPPCYTDAECTNALNQRGRCIFENLHQSQSLQSSDDNETLEGLRRQKFSFDQFSEPTTADHFERYLKRYLWAIFKNTVTKEPTGYCVLDPNASRLKPSLSSADQVGDDGGWNTGKDTWQIIEEPLEFDIPSVLRKAAPGDRIRVALGDLQRTVNIGSLGEIECSAITKLGHYDGIKGPTHGFVSSQNGIPIHGAFLIKFSPLMTIGEKDSSVDMVRYVAEPYEFIASRQKIAQVLGYSESVPEYKIIHRREMKSVLTALAELSGLAILHPQKGDSITELLNYVDPTAFTMLKPALRKVSRPHIYAAFREVTHGIELANGVLTLLCDNPGEGLANVEITYFMPSPELLSAIEIFADYLAGGPFDGTGASKISVADFLLGLEYSTLDQNTCSTRILCLQSLPSLP